ncbi:hypothetical protein Poli38472_002668 [Pythium oligandrum]|uniref:Uncharacterized protein n=1 Tax=Pythium oligandrum TaxID=41045 RepID=A0A8K1CHX7_PYTOL|nr:hypothetical protein Poli38472_002668 [Pythium oligandrum]|eukprot:TMW63727.1 hypothetical protein Poli38472_002668 [Pythium oligandrum]
MELLADTRKVEIPLKQLDKLFICTLCNGYLRDVQTINEFCNGCIRLHFAQGDHGNKSPTCHVDLGTKPHSKLVPDQAIRGLVDKLFPRGYDEERTQGGVA